MTCPCRSLHYCSTSPVALKEKDTELLISERKLCLRDEYDICDQAERQQEEETELMTLCFSFVITGGKSPTERRILSS